MDRSEKIARLRSMLQQVAPENQLESIAAKHEQPPGGLESIEAPEQANARNALEKLMSGREDLSPAETDGLEAIVMPRERPVVFLRKDSFDVLPDPWTHLNDDPLRRRLLTLSPSVGRVELPTSTAYPYGGTGFVVGPDLLMTNRHVAMLFAVGLGLRDIRYLAGDSAVNFTRYKRETGDPPEDESATLKVREVVMIHPYWDMALLRVDGLTNVHSPLILSTRHPDELAGMEVTVLGYPARDNRSDLDLQDRIFSRVYYVKRLQPGKIRDRQQILSYGNNVNALTHDSSTLGGNSGSAIFDLKTGQVVGLHFAGVYLKANYAVPAYELARLPGRRCRGQIRRGPPADEGLGAFVAVAREGRAQCERGARCWKAHPGPAPFHPVAAPDDGPGDRRADRDRRRVRAGHVDDPDQHHGLARNPRGRSDRLDRPRSRPRRPCRPG